MKSPAHRFILVAYLVALAAMPAAAQTQEATTTRAEEDEGIASRIRLRPIDRAAVRVVSINGAIPYTFKGGHTDVTRVVALRDAGHGTGVAVDANGLILTARHVVQPNDFVAVIFAGSTEPVPARVVFVDVDHDLAFLKVDVPTPNHIEVPRRVTPLTLAERLYTTGYPLDVRETYPAAVSGDLSRENRDGLLQVAMSVNPGNSGGPVIDGQGRLVGIMSRRGEPRAGVAGIALLEPLRFIIPAHEQARERLQERPPATGADDVVMARVVADFVRTNDDRPIYETTAIPTIREAARRASTPERAMIVASHAWNMHIMLLENRRVRDIDDLSGEDKEQARQLRSTAVRLAEHALEAAPYVRTRYSVLRSIVNSDGRSYVPMDEDEEASGD